jgi:soluble lytic murein transglycosylase-like protein
MLESVALELDEFWIDQARGVMATLAPEMVSAWRTDRRREVLDTSGHSRWRALARWAALEPDAAQRRTIAEQVGREFGTGWEDATPSFAEGLAADLWRLGLGDEAARWDAGGFPSGAPLSAAWSAHRFLDFDLPWLATRVADAAWRQAGSVMPTDVLPVALQRAMYPLPRPDAVRRAADEAGVDWSLLAAVAREESRWDSAALSAVGARGLLQLMPATAAAVASRVGRDPPTADDLFDPQINLELGSIELARLIEDFEGRRAPAVAAYNAGQAQAMLWLDQCGAGCSDGLYLVNISFSATRTYSAHVLVSAARYRQLYGETARPVAKPSGGSQRR